MRTNYSPNDELQSLIVELRKTSAKEKVNLWEAVARDLSKPSRLRREVNLSRIDRFTEENDTVVIPGKVLSSGDVSKKVMVAAYNFSKAAKDKITKADGKAISIKELLKQNPKAKDIRILG